MSTFARHGIKHLSASSLNLFASEPALWVGKYLLGWKDEFGAAANRGNAVEAGLDHWLYAADRGQETIRQASQKALDFFALRTDGVADEEHDAERAVIPAMLFQACQATRAMPCPVARQLKTEFWIDGIDVPVIGYVDYVFDDGIVDLKTTKRMPSQPSKAHLSQMAGYFRARNEQITLLYVTDKKHQLRPVTKDECEEGYADLCRAAWALRHVLASSRDAHEAASFYVPDFSDFRWNDQLISSAKSLYQEINDNAHAPAA